MITTWEGRHDEDGTRQVLREPPQDKANKAVKETRRTIHVPEESILDLDPRLIRIVGRHVEIN